MLNRVKQFFKRHHDMANTVDYLTNHISYHLIHTYKLSRNSDTFAMFGREQLTFLVTSVINGLNERQINQIINLAFKNVVANLSANFMVTRNAIYIALV